MYFLFYIYDYDFTSSLSRKNSLPNFFIAYSYSLLHSHSAIFIADWEISEKKFISQNQQTAKAGKQVQTFIYKEKNLIADLRKDRYQMGIESGE